MHHKHNPESPQGLKKAMVDLLHIPIFIGYDKHLVIIYYDIHMFRHPVAKSVVE